MSERFDDGYDPQADLPPDTPPRPVSPTASLTFAVLAAVMAEFPPPMRFVVGIPEVGENEVIEAKGEHHLIAVGREAFEKLRAHAQPMDPNTDPFGLTFGLTVEQYGDRADHGELRVMLLQAMAQEVPSA